MKAVIADDEPLARELLRALLERSGLEVIGEAGSGSEAVELVAKLRPDVAFLDIDMPLGDGISAASRVARTTDTQLVFVTAHEPYAIDAFELGAADYLLKPVRSARLSVTLERIRSRLEQRSSPPASRRDDEPVIWIRTRSGDRRLDASEIIWIEAQSDHVLFHTKERSFLHRTTMEQLERELASTDLIRVHRSSIVRINAIRAVERKGKGTVLRLDGGATVAVSASYRSRLRETLAARARSLVT